MANRTLVPQAREGLNKFKMEAASQVGVIFKRWIQWRINF